MHIYERMFHGELGQVRDRLILEATWLGHFEPYKTTFIQSYIAEMMVERQQEKLIEEYYLQPFEVKVLIVERTLCEKIMSLVRFSFTETPIQDLNNKVRHTYDIYKLLQEQDILKFFNSSKFDEMLLKVANDDVGSFRTNAWLSNHPKTALIFSDTANTWGQISRTYNSTFKELVYGNLPTDNDILNTLQQVSKRLESVNWTILKED